VGCPAAVLVVAAFGVAPVFPAVAFAQSASCSEIQTFLVQRKTIAGSLTVKKGQQMDAGFACAGFGKLVANGNALIKWVDANKDWCQIPDNFVTGIKEDHGRATTIRAKACGVAAKQAQMEKKAKEGGSGGLLGGGGLEGPTRLPQGAL
jgi:hypothetical protein